MAEFNQRQSSAAPVDYTGSSRGIQASRNDAVGRLFSGLADTFEMGVKEQNRNIVANIEKDVFDEYDAAQAEFGVPEATDMEADPETDSFAATPEGVTRASRQLESLHTAYQRGALKESHYWARMNSAVRQLRGKYPGYRDEIDRMVSGVTGATPANALRSALMREWNEQSGQAGSETDTFGKYVEWANKQGYLPVDYYDRLQGGNPYGKIELEEHVARKTRQEVEMNSRQKQMGLQAEQDKLSVREVEQNYRTEAVALVTAALQDGTSAGQGFAKIQETLREAQRAAAAGDPVPQQELEKLKGTLGQLKADIRMSLNERFTASWTGDPKHSYSTYLDNTQMEAAINSAMVPINIIEQALDSEEPWGMLGAVAADIEARKLDSQTKLMEALPVSLELAALQETLGTDLTSQYMKMFPEFQNELDQALAGYYHARAATAKTTGANVLDEFSKAEEAGRGAEYYQGIVARWTKTVDSIASGALPPELLSENVAYMFGPGSEAIMAQIEPSSQAAFYDKVASPIVTRQIMALRDQGDVEAWETYRSFVATTFQSMFLQDVQSLQGLVTNDALQITWNDTAKQFDAKVVADPLTGFPLETTGFAGEANKRGLDNQTKKLQNSLAKLNSAIRNVTPIVEDAGSDTSREIMAMLLEMGYDPDAPQAKGVLGKLGNALKGLFTGRTEETVLDDMEMRGAL